MAVFSALPESISAIPKHMIELMKSQPLLECNISKANTNLHERLSDILNISKRFNEVTNAFSNLSIKVEPLEWTNDKEDHKNNRDKCFEYLNETLITPEILKKFAVHDATLTKHLLDHTFDSSLKVMGTTDFIIYSRTTFDGYILPNCFVAFELFKPSNTDNKINQAVLELLICDRKSDFNVILILTDLNDLWTIFWIEKLDNDKDNKIAKVCYAKVTRDVAVGFLRYHLKVCTKMLNNGSDIVDVENDEDYEKDSDSGSTKRQKFMMKSRPTFNSSSVRAAAFQNRDRSLDQRYDEMDIGQLNDQLIINFVEQNIDKYGHLVEFKKLDLAKLRGAGKDSGYMSSWLADQSLVGTREEYEAVV